MLKHSNWYHIGLVVSMIICVLGIGTTLTSWHYQNRVYPNVFAADVSLGGKDIKEGFQILSEKVQELEVKKVEVSFDKRLLLVSLKDLGISLDIEKTIQNSYQAKRNQRFIALPWNLLEKKTLSWVYNVDDSRIREAIPSSITGQITAPQNARFIWQDDSIMITPDVEGLSINFADLASKVVQAATYDTSFTVELPIITQQASLTEDRLRTLLPTVSNIIKPHTLEHNTSTWTLSSNEILEWIVINDTGIIDVNREKIQAFLSSIKDEVAQNPINAQLRFDSNENKVIVSQPSQTGLELNLESSTVAISNNLLGLQSKSSLMVLETKPTIHEDTIDSLGINEILGSGTSNFAGSPANRVHNIKVNAERTSGTLLAPGEEFSFVSKMGPVTAATGYLPELVIKGDRTIPEYGGGICQVSSTLFRATLNTTLPITERQAHSYIVSYYGTPGLDATIYTPRPDFRFKNTTDHHILLQHRIEGTQLTYEIYGTKPDTEARVIGPIVLSASPDGSMRTVVHREIYRDGEKIDTNSFYSNYRPPNTVTSNPLE